MWVGIDPGVKGGIAQIDDKLLLFATEMPSSFELNEYFKEIKPKVRHVYLEKAQAMSKGGQSQGASSTFTYAESYGIIQGILIAHEIPFTLIRPLQWQKIMFVGTKEKVGNKKRDPKKRSLEAANRVFAKSNSFWMRTPKCKNPHDGMIDAALLAEACRRSIS